MGLLENRKHPFMESMDKATLNGFTREWETFIERITRRDKILD